MTDKELLELAAKAVLSTENYTNDAYMRGWYSNWNPLIDDGDALRLAVKLQLCPSPFLGLTGVTIVSATNRPFTELEVEEDHNDDPYAATRRAIVRAAAEIGKEMK